VRETNALKWQYRSQETGFGCLYRPPSENVDVLAMKPLIIFRINRMYKLRIHKSIAVEYNTISQGSLHSRLVKDSCIPFSRTPSRLHVLQVSTQTEEEYKEREPSRPTSYPTCWSSFAAAVRRDAPPSNAFCCVRRTNILKAPVIPDPEADASK